MGRPGRRCVVFLAAILSVASWSSAGAEGPRISATLGGHPISIRRIATLRCHDASYPVIRCFRTDRAVQKDFARSVAGTARNGLNGTSSGVAYVRVFEHNGYEGASMYLTQDYDDLGDIGWNDRVSSFKTANGGSGVFYEHAGSRGATYPFSANVSSLGSWNDLFSSVEGSA